MPMPVLSTGQAIGISSERARYHATRLNVRVSRDMPHHELYPLIDIVLADASDGAVGLRSGHAFSGYTLADKDWFDSLADSDLRRVLEWLDKPHVRYEIEGARRRLIYDDLPAAVISHSYPEKLYSLLRAHVLVMPVKSMPARQWQQTLYRLQQQGIAKEELHWSGVMARLERAAEAGRGVKISRQDILDSIDYAGIRPRLTNELVTGKSGPACRARYRPISLFGGEDYREWLVSLPDYRYSFFGPHFTERNILLHIRTKTRFDINGRKLLFIEELQSDWHQATSKNACTRSRQSAPPAPFRKGWVGLGLKLMLLHAVEERFDGLAWTDGDIQASRYRAAIPPVQRIYNKSIGGSLLKLSKDWHGRISGTEFESKSPWFRIEAIKRKKPLAGKHPFVTLPDYPGQTVLSILEDCCKTELLQAPVFILPDGMAEYVRHSGLPLFGEKILFKN